MTPDDDPLREFRDAAAKSDLADALGLLQAHRDAGVVGHWLIAWVEKREVDGTPTIVMHTRFEDEIVGLGLARHVGDAIARSWEDVDED